MPALFDRIGGEDAVGAVVNAFYDRVLDDPSLAKYLNQVDLGRLREHQREFMAAALGGPDAYSGRSIRAAHQGLGITDADFDAFVGHLTAALRETGVSDANFREVIDVFAPFRDEIVTIGR